MYLTNELPVECILLFWIVQSFIMCIIMNRVASFSSWPFKQTFIDSNVNIKIDKGSRPTCIC